MLISTITVALCLAAAAELAAIAKEIQVKFIVQQQEAAIFYTAFSEQIFNFILC